jgi:Cellulase (glycosyl hydrolase family 5)
MVLNMDRRLRSTVIVLALAISACSWLILTPAQVSARAGRAHLASNALLGGINVTSLGAGSTFKEADQAIAVAGELHANIVRSQIPWDVFEPRGPGLINARALAVTDRLVADASAAGIRVVMTVDGTPCWASAAPAALARKCSHTRQSAANAWPPTDPKQYGAFVAYLAGRYGTQLAAIEVWNEPDQSNEDYLAGPHKAQRYAELLRAAYPAIKQANPQVTVLGGSLVGSNGAFLRALYAAGIKGYYDGLAVHYYDLTLGSLRSIHETQRANGDTTPLWLDEFGWPSCWPHRRLEQEQACVTPQIQAANIVNLVHSLASIPYVAAYAVYKTQDSASEAFGVLLATGARKLSFAALSQVLASPLGGVSPVTLSLHRSGGHVFASGSASVGDFMGLEAFTGGVLHYRALFTLNRFNRYSLTLPSALGTHGLRVRVFQFWAGQGKGAQRSI